MTRLSRIASRARVLARAASIFAWVALAPTSPARADTVVLTTVPFAFSGTSCTGEPFTGTGELHFLVSGNLSASGMAQSRLEANLQGLQAVGAVSGKKYVVVDTSTQTLVFDTPDLAPYHETLEWIAQFIRQGEDGNRDRQ